MPLLLTYGPQLTVQAIDQNLAIGEPGVLTFRAQGNVGPVTWRLLSSTLPAEWDASLNVSELEATLTTEATVDPGAFSAAVSAVDTTRQPVSATGTVRVAYAPLLISGGPLDVWRPYVEPADTLTVSGGTGDYIVVRLVAGAPPENVAILLNPFTATISFSGVPEYDLEFGDPPVTGSLTLEVEDSEGATARIALSWIVEAEAPPIEVDFVPSGPWNVGEAVPQTFSVTGGSGTYVSATLGTGSLPAGVTGFSVAGSTVSVTGTPTTPGSGSFSVVVEDSLGNTGAAAYSWEVVAAMAVTGTFPDAVAGEDYDETLPITGGTGTYVSATVISGAKPPWATLEISGSNARLHGTCDDVGATYTFQFRVTDSGAATADSEAQSVEVTGDAWTWRSMVHRPVVVLDDESSVTDAGSGACSQWNDIGDYALHHTQSTGGSRPLIVSAGLNGKRVIQHDGSDDTLHVASTLALGVLRDVEFAWMAGVWRKNSASADASGERAVYGAIRGGASVGIRMAQHCHLSSGAGNRLRIGGRRLDADGFTSASTAAAFAEQWLVTVGVHDYSTGAAIQHVNGEIEATNGSAFSTGRTSNTDAVTGSGLSTAAVFSASGPAAQNFGDVSIAAIMLGNIPFASGDLDKLTGYLAHSWALQSSLPSDHPYKLGPPRVSPSVNQIALAIYRKTILWAELDESSGSSAADAGPNNITGTYTGVDSYTATGISGNGKSFNASSGSRVYFDNSALNRTTDYTIAAWYRRNDSTATRTVYARGTASNYVNTGSGGSSGSLVWVGPSIVFGGGSFNDGWHVAWMMHSNGRARACIDGQATPTGTVWATDGATSALAFFGREGQTSGWRGSNAVGDRCMMFVGQLTRAEREYLYNSGSGISFAALKAAAGVA